MVLSIKNSQADELARQLAELTGESITEAVTEAIRLRVEEVRRGRAAVGGQLLRIADQGSRLPRLDDRSDEDILGYDQKGMPR